MKRPIVALSVFFALAAALQPLTAAASEAWILNIPVRGIPNQESGMVRATLELSAAPAGSQLVVNGSTTLNLGDTQIVAGDSVTYEALTGNNVRITYVPLSNFGADFCAGNAAAGEEHPDALRRRAGRRRLPDVDLHRRRADGRVLAGVEAHRRHAGQPDPER